jgi:hypothetical protein
MGQSGGDMKKSIVIFAAVFSRFATAALAGDLPLPTPPVQAPFGNDIGGTLWITVARGGNALQKSASADALVCSTTGGALDLAFTPTKDTSGPFWYTTIPANQCVCAPRPAYVIVQNQGGAEGKFTGTIQWTPPGQCVALSNSYQKPPEAPAAYVPGPAKTTFSTCKPHHDPNGYYTAACDIVLPPGSSRTRVCHSAGWVVPKDGQNFNGTGGFPERFIFLTTGREIQATPGVQYDTRWGYIAPGCFDLIGVTHASFMLHSDQNVDPGKVSRMVYTVQRLH